MKTMRTISLFAICLLAMATIKVSAQDNGRLLYKSQWQFVDPHEEADPNDNSIKWATSYKILDSQKADSLTKLMSIEGVLCGNFEGENSLISEQEINASMGCFRLVQEQDSTVLYCYYVTHYDATKNIWLGGDETFIVDMQTGEHYLGHAPKDIWNDTFSVKAKKGSVIEFKITFPKLKDSVKEISIYGVPRWNLRGYDIDISKKMCAKTQRPVYDEVPSFHVPHLVKPATNYNKDDMDTYSEYDNAHTILPMPDTRDEGYKFAMWRTPETTYLAIGTEMNWNHEYFRFSSETSLIDQATGKKYKVRKLQGLPFNDLFFIKAHAGDWVAFVMEFPPLPESVTTVTYSEPAGEPFHVWGACWDETNISNLDIEEIRDNQSLFKYLPEVIYK